MNTSAKVLGEGYGSTANIISGELLIIKNIYDSKDLLSTNSIIYIEKPITLFEAALISLSKPKGVIVTDGNKNSHSLIFFKDLLIPSIIGTGRLTPIPKKITMDCDNGKLYEFLEIHNSTPDLKNNITGKVYANVGSEEAIIKSFELGAKGIGIFRTEFTAVRFLAENLTKEILDGITVKDYIQEKNEADAIYFIAQDPKFSLILKEKYKTVLLKAVSLFKNQPIIVRSIDIERNDYDSMGYRGIRRCLAENGGVLKIIAAAIVEVINETKAKNISVIFPLVSNYEQIYQATNLLISEGLCISNSNSKSYVKIGWKIEQPVSVINLPIWLLAFKNDFKKFPDYLGIGSNDLTQFTLSVGRNIEIHQENYNIQKYINNLYDESDFSIVRMLFEISSNVKGLKTEVILHGELGNNPDFAKLLYLLNIKPSVTVLKLSEASKVQVILEKEKIDTQDFINDWLNKYKFNKKIRAKMLSILLKIGFPS